MYGLSTGRLIYVFTLGDLERSNSRSSDFRRSYLLNYMYGFQAGNLFYRQIGNHNKEFKQLGLTKSAQFIQVPTFIIQRCPLGDVRL